MTWISGGYQDWFSINRAQIQFQLQINRRASTLYQNFDDAADHAAKLLYKEWGHRPLYLALSGGLDSELVARILVKNNIPFTPIILKIGKLNAIETWYAEYWCHINNFTPVILEYSVEEMAKHTARLSAKLTQVRNYMMTTVLLAYEHVYRIGGHCVFSAGDINFDLDRKQFYCAPLDFLSNIVDRGRHPTAFFMYTPELALSYVHQFDTNQNEQYNKIAFYKISPRPKINYLTLLADTEGYHDLYKKLHSLFKLEKNALDYPKYWHWYGTKEQLVEQLQP